MHLIRRAGALKSLYGHYQRKFNEWAADEEARANGSTPPVFIVVCNNTNVSKAVFDYVAGYETEHRHPDGEPVVAPGALELFNNVKDQRWLHRPNTILVDSRQLENRRWPGPCGSLEPHSRSLWAEKEGEGRKGADRENHVGASVNNLGTFGRWAFLEIDGSNLHKTKQEIRKLLKGGAA